MPAAPAREIRQGTLQLEIKTVQIHVDPDSLKNQFQRCSVTEVGNGSNFAPVCRRFV
ncbi:hypothetical protein C7S15_4235 [Burkholderia cepacia]|nr:hypothetical protein [Burkholderia cepacia]